MAGNATITLFNGNKSQVFEVWLQTISTGAQNEFVTQQVRDKMSWQPLRRGQMLLKFTIAWPLLGSSKTLQQAGFEGIDPRDGFGKLNKFQDTIRAHQKSMVNGSTTMPMHVSYYNNSDIKSPLFNQLISTKPLNPLSFNGWIKSVEKQYVRFQNMFVTQYEMNVLTKNSSVTPTTAWVNQTSYAPATSDQVTKGKGWYANEDWLNISSMANAAKQIDTTTS